jgi:P63C domain
MTAADAVIAKFGGAAALAKLIGKGPSTISYWKKIGIIPAKWQPILLNLAAEMSVSLSPMDFVMPPAASGAADSNPAEDAQASVPKATHWADLHMGAAVLPAYVLDDGTRVFSLKGVVVGLIGTDGGQLAEYLKVRALRDFLPDDLKPAEDGSIPALIRFDTGREGGGEDDASRDRHFKYAVGFPVERFMDLCSAYSSALMYHLDPESGFALTRRQIEIAQRAVSFQRACSKVGIIAMVDEATGYQYERTQDELRLKLNLFLAEEMRKWESTFPEQLWIEFGRLTKWKGPVHSRPKYWGKLVMELIYGYLDADVAKWLKEHAPKPRHGQNYHQWLSGQYGLKRLMEHIWMVIGMGAACQDMPELRARMAERYGRHPVQMTFYLPPPRPKPPGLQGSNPSH